MPTLPNYPNRVIRPGYTNTGWTSFVPSSDTRITYVTTSGSHDSYCGFSPTLVSSGCPGYAEHSAGGGHGPKKTISAGVSNLRDGYPDWLLLKKGDSWNETFGSLERSGRNSSEPMLISSYGSGERPIIRPGAGDGFLWASGNSSPHDVAIVDLHVNPQVVANNAHCIAWTTGGGRLLVEGCRIEQFDVAVGLLGGSDFAFRRNTIVDCHGQGMYVSYVSGLLIEENIFDHLGLPNPDIYKHGLYIDNEDVSGVVVRNNIITDTSSHGLQLRPGGVVEDNLFARNAIALLLGGGDSWQSNPNGVNCEARRNVILDARDIDAGNQRGWGIELKNIASALVVDNILANSPSAGYPRPVIIGGPNSDGRAFNVTFSDNVISGWDGPGVEVLGGAQTHVSNLTLGDNDIQNLVSASYLVDVADAGVMSEISASANKFYSTKGGQLWFNVGGVEKTLAQWAALCVPPDTTSTATQVSYPSPDAATIAHYHASLGKTATHEAFMLEARQQRKGNWRVAYTAQAVNAYIRQCFGK